jgi:hypothetical protein
MAKRPWKWFDHQTDVPQWVAAGIGRATIEWAVVERELEELINLLLDVDIQISRIMVNRMNARNRIDAVRNLIQGHVLAKTLPAAKLTEFNKLSTAASAAQGKRDILAHGLWSKHNNEWWVLKLRQARNTPHYAPDLPKLSRAVLPQREQINAGKLRSIAKEIVGVATGVQMYRENLESALAPSRYNRLPYTRKRHTY